MLDCGTAMRFACHRNVANSKVCEENGVVDADAGKDPNRVLLLTDYIGVDQDQKQSDTDESGDIAEHLPFPLPGQFQVY